MNMKLNKIANDNFKRIFSENEDDFENLEKLFEKNMYVYEKDLTDEDREKWVGRLEERRLQAKKPSYLKAKIAAIVAGVGFLIGVGSCTAKNIGKSDNESTPETSVTTTTTTGETTTTLESSKTEEQDTLSSKYAFNYRDFDVVSTRLAKLGDINVINTNSWLAGSKTIHEDTELMMKFYLAANSGTLYEADSVYSDVVKKYSATDLYTSFFQVLDSLQVKAVFATGDSGIRFSKYFVSSADKNYLENLENLLINYNNAQDKSKSREAIATWVEENVVKQNYGSVSKSAVIVSYRLIQNARLTNAVENVLNINDLRKLDEADDKYKVTPDYLITKFIDSKELSCTGTVKGTKAVLSDDTIDFINIVKEFHETLFKQNSKNDKDLIQMTSLKRREMVKEVAPKTDEQEKDEYLDKLKKVDPTNPALKQNGTTYAVTTIGEKDKASIRQNDQKTVTSVVKDPNGRTLSTGSSAFDVESYQRGYSDGSAKGAYDGSQGKERNLSVTGKSEYVAGYKLGYNESYNQAKAIYDRAVRENKNPKVSYVTVASTTRPATTTKQTATQATTTTKQATTTRKTTAAMPTGSNATTTKTSFELAQGITIDPDGTVRYNGQIIDLSEEDKKMIRELYGVSSNKTYKK